MRTSASPLLLRPPPAWRRWAAACALLAVLAVSLGPAVARLLQPLPLGDLAALCTGATDRSGPSGPAGAGLTDACALCVLAHAAPLLHVPPAPLPPVVARANAAPIIAGAATATGTAPWRARARAPPRLG